jgi:hypothetical protein
MVEYPQHVKSVEIICRLGLSAFLEQEAPPGVPDYDPSLYDAHKMLFLATQPEDVDMTEHERPEWGSRSLFARKRYVSALGELFDGVFCFVYPDLDQSSFPHVADFRRSLVLCEEPVSAERVRIELWRIMSRLYGIVSRFDPTVIQPRYGHKHQTRHRPCCDAAEQLKIVNAKLDALLVLMNAKQ